MSCIPLAPPTILTPLSNTEAAAFFVVSTVPSTVLDTVSTSQYNKHCVK